MPDAPDADVERLGKTKIKSTTLMPIAMGIKSAPILVPQAIADAAGQLISIMVRLRPKRVAVAWAAMSREPSRRPTIRLNQYKNSDAGFGCLRGFGAERDTKDSKDDWKKNDRGSVNNPVKPSKRHIYNSPSVLLTVDY